MPKALHYRQRCRFPHSAFFRLRNEAHCAGGAKFGSAKGLPIKSKERGIKLLASFTAG